MGMRVSVGQVKRIGVAVGMGAGPPGACTWYKV